MFISSSPTQFTFFIIFRELVYSEMGFGDWVTVSQGFALFFRMALGGVAVGIACALALVLVLYELDRRLERDYDVLQVVAALSTAYMSYYIADAVAGMSGIVACTTTGVVSRALSKGLINDEELMDTYLGLMEHALNTLLFALGGVIWGVVITAGNSKQVDSGEDWAYLIVLYLFVILIRFVSLAIFYPLFSRIGLKSDWREATFLGYGGLRGSVGVALAVNFYRTISQQAGGESPERYLAAVFMFCSGGISLLSLLVNGTTAGIVLVLDYLFSLVARGLLKELTPYSRHSRSCTQGTGSRKAFHYRTRKGSPAL